MEKYAPEPGTNDSVNRLSVRLSEAIAIRMIVAARPSVGLRSSAVSREV